MGGIDAIREKDEYSLQTDWVGMKTGGWKQPNGEMNIEANRMDLEPNRHWKVKADGVDLKR
jgi:hypothetical protein